MTAKCLLALLPPAALSPHLCPACLLVLDVMIKFIFKSAASLRSMTPETRSEPNLDRKPQSGPMPSRLLTL